MVADQVLAADRVVDRAGRLDLLPGGIRGFLARVRRAVTSHDVLQHLRFQPPKNRELLAHAFGKADLILSVSHFNTRQLVEAFPGCEGRVAHVPNAAEDLFFEPASPRERAQVRADLALPARVPYLLSVANLSASQEPRPTDPGRGRTARGGLR